MHLKKWLPLIIIVLLMVNLTITLNAQSKKTLTIGIILDGHWEKNQIVLEMFKKEIRDLLETEYDVVFPKDKTITGDWTIPSIQKALDTLLADKETDIILAIGLSVSDEAGHRPAFSKPVIAPLVIDETLQELPQKNKSSGVKNLNYLVSIARIDEGIRLFRRVVGFDRVTLMIPDFVQRQHAHAANRIAALTKKMDLLSDIIWVGATVDTAISQLNPNIQALYISPMLHVPQSEIDKLLKAANKLKIPTFSHIGEIPVESGLLATMNRDNNFTRLARRVALNIQRILMGEDAGTFPIEFRTDIQLTINMKIARQIGVYPTWDIMNEAQLVNEEEAAARKPLTIMNAVNRALSSNLELLSKQTGIRAGKQDIRAAAAKLLPQINVSGTYLKIDDDRASSSMGNTAENSLYGSASLTQVIYSEPALANLSIQKHVQLSREAQLDQVTLDIALSAATACVNVLRAKALVAVQKNNMIKTKDNLELAKVRESLGAADASEVYRWEAQYAVARKDLMDAATNRELAEVNLNRIMHVPMGERFKIEDTGLDSPFLATSDDRFYTYIDNPYIFRLFMEFMVVEGLKQAPELAQLNAAIAAKKRYHQSTRNRFFMPTVALKAGVDNYFSKTGAGTGDRDMSVMLGAFSLGQVQALASLFPQPANDLNWNVALNVSLPVFSGGERLAETKKTKLELRQLEADRAVVAEKLEQRIRATIHQASTSYAKISLSREAADAASKTLEMVTDAYSRGAVSILSLIDAQNAALAADRSAANAVYDFLLDLFDTQRAINRLDFQANDHFQVNILDAFENYLKSKGISRKKRQVKRKQ